MFLDELYIHFGLPISAERMLGLMLSSACPCYSTLVVISRLFRQGWAEDILPCLDHGCSACVTFAGVSEVHGLSRQLVVQVGLWSVCLDDGISDASLQASGLFGMIETGTTMMDYQCSGRV